MAENQQAPFSLEQVMPLLLLASPLIEAGNPGVGMNLASGVLNYQRDKKERQNRILFGLAKDFADLGDENKDVLKALLKNAGIEPDIFEGAWAARKAFADPHAATNKYLDEMITGVIGGQEFTGPRRLIQPSQIESAQRGEIAGQEAAARQRAAQEQAAAEQGRFERGQLANLAGQARSTLVSIALNPRATPQSQARARALLQQLNQGADPKAILEQIPALAGQLAPAKEPKPPVGVKTPRTRQQVAAEIAKLDRRLAQIESYFDNAGKVRIDPITKQPVLTVTLEDKFSQEYNRLNDQREELLRLLAPAGR